MLDGCTGGAFASRESLDLPGNQQQLLEAVAATGKPVMLVLLNGRPLNITWASAHVPAILEAWYPGAQGGSAVADVLLGNTVPLGKLPFTWPRNVGQVPIYYAHNTTQDPEDTGRRYWEEQSAPRYPFGYGLSYAKFNYSNLRVSKSAFNPDEQLEILAGIATGRRTSADWVMYRNALAAAAEARGWAIHWYDAKKVFAAATEALRIENLDAHFLQMRRSIGSPWGKDHKVPMSAAIVAARARQRQAASSTENPGE